MGSLYNPTITPDSPFGSGLMLGGYWRAPNVSRPACWPVGKLAGWPEGHKKDASSACFRIASSLRPAGQQAS
jgi:hypothetical protein